jgi:serine/threonine protein phosphatase PrpC
MSPLPGGLILSHGRATRIGARQENQDYAACVTPASLAEFRLYGAAAVVADGIGGVAGGRVAAELAVRLFLEGYYQLPPTLGIAQRAHRAIESANRWIHDLGRRDPGLERMGCTFSALILRGRQAHLFHVGDSRIYRLRGDGLECLTHDHVLPQPGYEHVLYRAIGLEDLAQVEHRRLPLEPHDRFLLCSDGVHDSLDDHHLRELLARRAAPSHAAEHLVESALDRGASDNVTAVVVDVVALPGKEYGELLLALRSLPIAPPPKVGAQVNGFTLTRVLAAGRYSLLFEARPCDRDAPVVLKWPQPAVASDADYREAFAREAWIGASVKSPWVAEIVELEPDRQTCLYSVMPYYAGQTLEQRIARRPPVTLAEGGDIGLKLCRAVYALHKHGVIHRDIKPDNMLLPDSGGLRLLDLGIARLPAWEEDPTQPIPGTTSYMAPELFQGERGSQASDVFAVGVTLYRLFTGGAYPFGEIEAFSHPCHGQPKPLTHYRPDLPAWLETVLHRAIAVDPEQRYADAMELAHELEAGLAKGAVASRPARVSLYERNPLAFWKALCATLLLALLAALHRLTGS